MLWEDEGEAPMKDLMEKKILGKRKCLLPVSQKTKGKTEQSPFPGKGWESFVKSHPISLWELEAKLSSPIPFNEHGKLWAGERAEPEIPEERRDFYRNPSKDDPSPSLHSPPAAVGDNYSP